MVDGCFEDGYILVFGIWECGFLRGRRVFVDVIIGFKWGVYFGFFSWILCNYSGFYKRRYEG